MIARALIAAVGTRCHGDGYPVMGNGPEELTARLDGKLRELPIRADVRQHGGVERNGFPNAVGATDHGLYRRGYGHA